jgi:deoxyribonuclease V
MDLKTLHSWDLDYAAARDVQERLRGRILLRPLSLKTVEFVAGSDIAVSKKLGGVIAAVVVSTFPGLEVVETRVAAASFVFPYIPGLLSFREIPVLVKCLLKVRTPFDVMLCDGQGIAHPRGLGLASHLGLMMGVPAVGCAKSRLVGDYSDPGPKRGEYSPLLYKGKNVGSVLRTRDGVKPLFISPGHLVDIPSSRRIVLATLSRCRLPEPTRRAHAAAGEEKRRREE